MQGKRMAVYFTVSLELLVELLFHVPVLNPRHYKEVKLVMPQLHYFQGQISPLFTGVEAGWAKYQV
jgi:hypothetical protein